MEVLVLIVFVLVFGVGYNVGREDQGEDCPRVVLNYDCRGHFCDHRKSELYKAKYAIAKTQEEREAAAERKQMLKDQERENGSN